MVKSPASFRTQLRLKRALVPLATVGAKPWPRITRAMFLSECLKLEPLPGTSKNDWDLAILAIAAVLATPVPRIQSVREAQIFIQRSAASVPSWLRCTAALVALACVAALGEDAQAAGDYPRQPIRILVPYGPGGAGDLTIRLLANKLSQNLKQPFVIENRPGAGGIAAMRAVLSAPADGYTLGEMRNGQAISMSLFQNLPYDVLNDFAQISVAASFAMLLAGPPTPPYKSGGGRIGAAAKAPG